MKAGEIRCPECGEGFQDVNPDFELDPSKADWGPYPATGFLQCRTNGHCRNGHRLDVVCPGDETGLPVVKVCGRDRWCSECGAWRPMRTEQNR